MTDPLSPDEIAAENGEPLPDREVMSLLGGLPGGGDSSSLLGTPTDGSTPTGTTPADGASSTAGHTAGMASSYTPPPTDGPYTPNASSSA